MHAHPCRHTQTSHILMQAQTHTHTHTHNLYLYCQQHGIQFWLCSIAHMHVSHQEARQQHWRSYWQQWCQPYTWTYFYYGQTWLHGPNSEGKPARGNKTGGPIGSSNASLISTAAWPHQYSNILMGPHLWACKTHEMREVGYGLEWWHWSEYPSRTAGCKISHLYIATHSNF